MSLPTPTLHTARLQLRPFVDDDANDNFALQSNAYVLRSWDVPPWSERERAERFITAREDGTGGYRSAAGRRSGLRRGVHRLVRPDRWNPDYRSASLGYCFDDAAWGHGYATEAARVLLRWAFETLDLNRVQAVEVMHWQDPSSVALRSLAGRRTFGWRSHCRRGSVRSGN